MAWVGVSLVLSPPRLWWAGLVLVLRAPIVLGGLVKASGTPRHYGRAGQGPMGNFTAMFFPPSLPGWLLDLGRVSLPVSLFSLLPALAGCHVSTWPHGLHG
jgi:hypothetical protein